MKFVTENQMKFIFEDISCTVLLDASLKELQKQISSP